MMMTLGFGEGKAIELTYEEQQWLDEHPVIYYAPDSAYAPYEYFDNGEPKGIVLDLLKEIEAVSDLRFEYVEYESWGAVVDGAKKGSVDLIFATKTKNRSEYLIFTEIVLSYPNIVVSNSMIRDKITLENLGDYTIGYLNDYAIEEYIGLVYPEANVIGYDTIEDALKEVSYGNIDTLMGDIGQLSYYISKLNISNIVIQDETPYSYSLRFGVTKDQNELRNILDKALLKIDQDKKDEILRKWIAIRDERSFSDGDMRLIIAAVTVVLGLLLMIFGWNATLRHQVQSKTKELYKLNEELESKIEKRTASLEEANDELEASMDDLLNTQEKLLEAQRYAVLGELIVGVGHELNTPLGSSLTSITYMNKKTSELSYRIIKNDLSIKDVAEFLDMALQSQSSIISNLERSGEIIDRFKSLETSQWSGKKSVIHLNEFINEFVNTVGDIDRRLNTYSISIIGSDASIYTSKAWINEIFHALILNTLIHGYEGLDNGKIVIKLVTIEEKVRIIFEDFGKGISQEGMQNVFTPFYSTSDTDEHIGLGLSLIYSLVTREMNGAMYVESELGKYTRFIMEIPLAIE